MANVKGKDNYAIMPQITGIDIIPSAGTTGQVLTKTAGTSYNYAWQSLTLDGLTDTVITSNTTGEILKWNGTGWENNTLAEAGIAPASRNIVAGSGLTGGGTLASDPTLNVIGVNSIVANANDIQLVNDTAAPGNNQVYGTTGAGVKGWKADPSGAVADLASVTVANTTSVEISSPGWADILWNTTHVQNNSAVVEKSATLTDRILIKQTGLYLLAYSLSFDADVGEETINARVRINDVTIIPGSIRSASEDDEVNDLSNAITCSLTAGQFITLQTMASGAGNFLEASSNMMVTRLSGIQGVKGDTGSGSSILVKDEGTTVTGGPHTALNFVGSNVVVTNAGAGQATVTVSGGGGAGSVLQAVRTNVTNAIQTSVNITEATTVTSTSGVFFASRAITMIGNNTIRFQMIIPASGDNDNGVAVAVVSRSTTVVAAASVTTTKKNLPSGQILLDFYDTPGTGTHTYNVRVGVQTNTGFFNRSPQQAAPYGGTVFKKNCNITISEIS